MKLFLKNEPMLFVYAYISISKQSKKIKKSSGRQGATLIRALTDGHSNNFIFAC